MNQQSLSNFFYARKSIIINTLKYLKHNHIDYNEISINENLAHDITSFQSSIFIRTNFLDSTNSNNSIPSTNNLDNFMHVSAVNRVSPPSDLTQISPLPQTSAPRVLDYENSDGWLSTSFFYLFSNGKGDVTRHGRTINVSFRDAIPYYLSLCHIDNKGCLVFNFQKDRFFTSVCFLALTESLIKKHKVPI